MSNEAHTSRLKQLATEIRQQSQLAESMRSAQQRQNRMLPPAPKIPGFEFACLSSPSANVSGDFYDFINVAPQQLGVALGDVAGHGVEAAIVMGMAKKALQIYARGVLQPKQALAMTNEDLCHDLDQRTFVSAGYGILDIDKRVFTFARAGNQPPILVNPNRKPMLMEMVSPGMAIGADRTGRAFLKATQEIEIPLAPGDLLFQYTDGLNEATDKADVEFGTERIKQLLTSGYNYSLNDLLLYIESMIKRFIAPKAQDDDITMVAFRAL